MASIQKRLVQQQMDEMISLYGDGKKTAKLPFGWIQSTRLALGMSLRQLAQRIGVSVSALTHFEKREQTEAISIATLKKAALALDMELVYYFKPKGGTIQHSIMMQAQLKADEIMSQSNQAMKLEDQETSNHSQKVEVDRLAKDIAHKMPVNLWD